jgi:hypothetical protein
VTQICPVPLPLWMADSAGKGILIVAVCHGLAQLEARWDKPGAQAIWDTADVKVILGGVSDPATLDRLSRLCGEIALRTHSRTRTEDGRRARTRLYQHVRVLPPELLRTLAERRALVLRTNLSPIVRLRMAWRRRDYHRARRIGLAPHRAPQISAAKYEQRPRPATGTELATGNGPGPDSIPRWLNPPDSPRIPDAPGHLRLRHSGTQPSPRAARSAAGARCGPPAPGYGSGLGLSSWRSLARIRPASG